jgi:hypothetical protein
VTPITVSAECTLARQFTTLRPHSLRLVPVQELVTRRAIATWPFLKSEPRKSGSHETRRWREGDSNPRSLSDHVGSQTDRHHLGRRKRAVHYRGGLIAVVGPRCGGGGAANSPAESSTPSRIAPPLCRPKNFTSAESRGSIWTTPSPARSKSPAVLGESYGGCGASLGEEGRASQQRGRS